MSHPQRRRLRLGELLVAAGVLEESDLEVALARQRQGGGRLGRILIEQGLVSEDLMVRALSRQLGLPRLDLENTQLPGHVTRLLPVEVCERHAVFPLGREDERRVLRLAAADPTNYEALDEVAFRTGLKVEAVVVSASAVDRAIRRYYYGDRGESAVTLEPGDYGLSPQELVLDEQGAVEPAAVDPAAAEPESRDTPPAPVARQELEQLASSLAAEVRALRGLIELLVDKGVIDRDEYVSKVRGGRG